MFAFTGRTLTVQDCYLLTKTCAAVENILGNLRVRRWYEGSEVASALILKSMCPFTSQKVCAVFFFPELPFYVPEVSFCFLELAFCFLQVPFFPEVPFYFSKMAYCFPKLPFSFPKVPFLFTVHVFFQECFFPADCTFSSCSE